MSFLRLIVCVAGVYSMFLLWAIAQERLSVPFKTLDGATSEKFRSPLFLGTCQSILCSISAFIYIMLRRNPADNFHQVVGLAPSSKTLEQARLQENGASNGHSHSANGSNSHSHHHRPGHPDTRFSTKSLLSSYLRTSAFITCAAPFGFTALSYISYPAMVLGKSCKLVPVMIMNFLMYRRRFAPHKYLVVAMVTTGIATFMYLGDKSKAKAKTTLSDNPYANLIGITYLLINLALDGAVNSTQDEIFARYKVTGQQMMLWINIFTTCISSVLLILPLPFIPVIHESTNGGSELLVTIDWIRNHPSVIKPLLEFSITGALGQLFIFETLQHFGSLTLVTVTLTRKLFTMLLSVIVYKHTLTFGQWMGAAIVFAGISVEAWVKRKDIHAKKVIQEKEKAKIKSV